MENWFRDSNGVFKGYIEGTNCYYSSRRPSGYINSEGEITDCSGSVLYKIDGDGCIRKGLFGPPCGYIDDTGTVWRHPSCGEMLNEYIGSFSSADIIPADDYDEDSTTSPTWYNGTSSGSSGSFSPGISRKYDISGMLLKALMFLVGGGISIGAWVAGYLTNSDGQIYILILPTILGVLPALLMPIGMGFFMSWGSGFIISWIVLNISLIITDLENYSILGGIFIVGIMSAITLIFPVIVVRIIKGFVCFIKDTMTQ